MNGWIDRWINGWMDRWIDKWMNGYSRESFQSEKMKQNQCIKWKANCLKL